MQSKEKDETKFSVLMSVYQNENPDYFKKAIESILNQTVPCDEVMIIQDGKLTKELYAVLNYYKETYEIIHTYEFEENVKLGRALAKGVNLCRNNIIARMDTDDIAVCNRFELQLDYLNKHPEISAVGGYIQEFTDEMDYEKIKTMPETQDEICKYAKLRNPLNHMTVMFRKEMVLKAGNYMHFPYLEDYYLWSRMLASGAKFHNIPTVLVKARTSSDLYKRRGGYKYYKGYKSLRKEQKKMGLLNQTEYIKGVLCSAVITMQPNGLRKLLYQKILRK